ncbi:hypothetical protein [Cryobacterium sp. Sr3]|uniref:hypothetical protein n=1 Tax=Cryobacterium sp. Sr3 TaxID=1259194 RepID=UPI00141B5E6A|nr:hypothetical protein [Cryobacterium sp. Sr3]
MTVRVVDYTIDDGRDNPDADRLLTTILDPAEASEIELATVYYPSTSQNHHSNA